MTNCLHAFFPSGPLPPQNLSLSHVTTNSALITWSRHPRSIPDGFVVNVTRGLNTRSRYLPNGKLGSYTLRELTPGQHYYLALTSVKNTGQEQIHSIPQHLAFITCEWMFPNNMAVLYCTLLLLFAIESCCSNCISWVNHVDAQLFSLSGHWANTGSICGLQHKLFAQISNLAPSNI